MINLLLITPKLTTKLESSPLNIPVTPGWPTVSSSSALKLVRSFFVRQMVHSLLSSRILHLMRALWSNPLSLSAEVSSLLVMLTSMPSKNVKTKDPHIDWSLNQFPSQSSQRITHLEVTWTIRSLLWPCLILRITSTLLLEVTSFLRLIFLFTMELTRSQNLTLFTAASTRKRSQVLMFVLGNNSLLPALGIKLSKSGIMWRKL